jgi:hypothetical protein
VVTLVIAIGGPFLINHFLEEGIKSTVVIDSASSKSYASWYTNTDPDGQPAYLDAYFFDVQNPDEILKGAKPVVVQKGPYTFDEKFRKLNIEWSDDGDTVTYYTWKYYVFNEEKSGKGLTLDDKITVPYSTALGMSYYFSSLSPTMKSAAKIAMIGFVTREYQKTNEELSKAMDELNEWKPTTDDDKTAQAAMKDSVFRIQQETAAMYSQTKSFLETADVIDFLFKMLMCLSPNGISPFWVATPVQSYFGYFNDPLLEEVQGILDEVKEAIGYTKKWSTSVSVRIDIYIYILCWCTSHGDCTVFT